MNTTITKLFITLTIIISAFAFSHSVFGATIIVDTTNDSDNAPGECSLRDAITALNTESIPDGCLDQISGTFGDNDRIEFDVIGEIALGGDLPNIATPMTIDGLSHGGSCGVTSNLNDRDLRVSIDGSDFVFNQSASISSVRGLSIGHGIILGLGASHINIACNHIGVNLAGDDVYGNQLEAGILLSGANEHIIIGGPSISDRNVISGKDRAIDGRAVANGIHQLLIQNNYIGTNLAGDDIIPHCSAGISLSDGVDGITISDNLVSGTGDSYWENSVRCVSFVSPGADISTPGAISLTATDYQYFNLLMENNIVGLNASADMVLGNAGTGIQVNEVFGFSIQNNIVSGNGGVGIGAYNSEDGDIVGNKVGTDTSGLVGFGNALNPDYDMDFPFTGAVFVAGHDIRIGGPHVSDRNIIAGHNQLENFFVGGILVAPHFKNGSASSRIDIQNNYIGVGADGITSLPNFSAGVTFLGGAEESRVYRNTIKHSLSIPFPGFWQAPGVLLLGEVALSSLFGYSVSILENIITNNESGLAIDIVGVVDIFGGALALEGLGVNPNDKRDIDEGLNHLQNYPVIISAQEVSAGTSEVVFMADFQPGGYRIEFYTNDMPQGHFTRELGEFIQSATISHNGDGPELFNVVLPLQEGDIVSATATRIDSSLYFGYGATSEVGNMVIISGSGINVGNLPEPYITDIAHDGPYHIMTAASTHYLGECATSAFLTIGNCASGDSHDGVEFPDILDWEEEITIMVTASENGILNGWIDMNMDGTFSGPEDHVFENVTIPAGQSVHTFIVPAGNGYAESVARFRFISEEVFINQPNLSFLGEALDGEVEDYIIYFGQVPQERRRSSGGRVSQEFLQQANVTLSSDIEKAPALEPAQDRNALILNLITAFTNTDGSPLSDEQFNDFVEQLREVLDLPSHTETPDTISADTHSCPIITQYMRRGDRDGASGQRYNGTITQVTFLQQILTQKGYYTNTINGIFDTNTESAVKAWQVTHKDAVLSPWGMTTPSGFFYQSSGHHMNYLLGCSQETTLDNGVVLR